MLEAIREADLVLLAPGDPVLSIGIVLGVPGIRDALRGTSAQVVGITPELDDLGPSLAAVGVEPTADAVAALYRDLRATWLPSDASPRRRPRSRLTHVMPRGSSTVADDDRCAQKRVGRCVGSERRGPRRGRCPAVAVMTTWAR
ncbi:LPPG:FO 2-phospho-L-lactate transferase [Janibacter hoylei PVAS-1]|uniref:LPPG:FO 2-phospho-L-lactate transferase n=1 Tax=Janibacter hoylei PVAS-1 TaxID=1210046 RepID=K1DYP2_9MICO|nr:2-phospho-L-lactate transferase CofD family protein [Janibacter hoylei]EKA59891.1 LPPG:FO 2-phospho-L-lactate transferase [Janibacter hoylei PVAS-1]